MRKNISTLSAGVLLSLTLAACGGGTDEARTAGAPGAPESSPSLSESSTADQEKSAVATTDFPDDLCDLLPLETVQAILGPQAAPDPARRDDPEDDYPAACSYLQGGDLDLRTTVSLQGEGGPVSVDWHKEHGTFVSDLSDLGEGAFAAWTHEGKEWAMVVAPAGVLKDPYDGQSLPMVFDVSTNVAPDGDKVTAVTKLATALQEALGTAG